MSRPFKVNIVFTDNDVLVADATQIYVEDECLHVYKQDGEFAPRVHIGSYPLRNLYSWARIES